MPRGRIDKNHILSKVYRLKDELKDDRGLSESKGLANKYLDKVLDYLKEFSH